MEKIIQINYQNRNISIEENAYTEFQQYEEELKNYFSKEESGDEIMTDLKNRMAEILEEKLNAGSAAITLEDIQQLKANIGNPSDFDQDEHTSTSSTNEESTKQAPFEKKRLFRNKFKNERVIAGVCSGLAHYFSIDPIAVRIIFVLVTLFNMASFFSFNLGILTYIILWVVLPQEYAKNNISHKLFRNSKDKVVAGVCSGLAQFFNLETWIIRSIFLVPLLIHIFASHSPFKFHFLGTSLGSLMFVIYIVLWIITPIAKSSTDFMLLKGEPINLSTIQNPISMQTVNRDAKSTTNSFFKYFAYLLIIVALIVFIPTCFGFLFVSFLTFNIANVILHTALLKTLGWLAITLIFALPILAVLTWLIRKLAGFNRPSPVLRSMFFILWIVGIFSGLFVAVSLINNMKAFVKSDKTYNLNPTSDTLYVKPINPTTTTSQNVFFDASNFNDVINITTTDIDIKGVDLRCKASGADSAYMVVRRYSFGKNAEDANQNAEVFSFEPRIEGNTIYLPNSIHFPKNRAYRGQNVRVTIYVPTTKTVIISEDLKKQLKYRFNANKRGFYVSSRDFDEDDDMIHFGKHKGFNITIDEDDENDDVIRMKDREKAEIQEEINENIQDANVELEEAKRNLEDSKREAQRQIEDAQKELDRAQKEAQRKLDEANRKLESKK